MNFFSHKIANPVGNGPSWNEWADNLLTKMAREAKPECEDDPRGACRGQVINNDNEEGAGQSYQDGESVDGKSDQKEGTPRKDKGGKTASTKQAKCGKEMGESSDAGKVTEEHTDAAPGDDKNKDCKQKINNDPNYQKGESTKPGKSKGKEKKAVEPAEKADNKKADNKKAGQVAQFKKVASLNRQEKVALMLALSQNKNNPIQYVEAMVGLKVANLTEEEKTFLRKFWETMYDADYVAEMLADR